MRALIILVSGLVGCGFSPAIVDGNTGEPEAGSDAQDDAPPVDGIATIGFVQSNQSSLSNVSQNALAFTSPGVAGDLTVVVVAWDDVNQDVQDVTDSYGSVFTPVGPKLGEDPFAEVMYVSANIPAGANTITATMNAQVPTLELRLLQYHGLATSNPIDVAHSGHNNTGTMTDSGRATTTHWHDLLVGCNVVGATTTSTDGPGFTRRIIIAGDMCEDKEVTTTASYNATATQSSSNKWLMQMVALRAAD